MLKQNQYSSLWLPLTRRDAACEVPLTVSQQARWSYGNKCKTARGCVAVVRVLGMLRVDLLKKALDAVIVRHESLRTRFVEIDGVTRQCIDSVYSCQIGMMDLSGLAAPDREQEAHRLASEITSMKVWLPGEPLFEVTLLRLSDLEHVLILALDQIISDGISNGIILRELWALYRQASNELPLSLPPVLLQFGDYAVWQAKIYKQWRLEHEEYWKLYLRDARGVKIPTDFTEPGIEPSGCESFDETFGLAVSATLRDLAKQLRTFLSLIVLCIHVVVVSRWCNQRDLLLGMIADGRYRSELIDMVGFLASGLFIRLTISEEDSFPDLLRHVQRQLSAAYEHRDFGWAAEFLPDAVKKYGTDLRFNWLSAAEWERDIACSTEGVAGISFQSVPIATKEPVKFAVRFWDTGDDIALRVRYRPDCFRLTTIEEYCRSVRSLAMAVAGRPFARVGTYAVS